MRSSKHLSIVFNRGNCSCQKSYYLFLEYIAERTYFDASALPYKTLRLKSNYQIIKELACLRTISPEANSYYLCPGTSYYKHYGQTARTEYPTTRLKALIYQSIASKRRLYAAYPLESSVPDQYA